MGWFARLFGDSGTDGPYGADPNAPAYRQAAALHDTADSMSVWQLPSVVAARGLMADTTAMLPLWAFNRNGANVGRPPLLRRPDPTEPVQRTLERFVNQLTRHGGACLEVLDTSARTGYPLGWRVVHKERWHANIDPEDRRVVRLTVDGQFRPQPDPRYMYVPFILDDGPVGVTPFEECRAALEQALAVHRYSTGFYGNPLPPFVLESADRLSPARAGEVSAQWMAARLERRPPVASGGMKVAAAPGMSAADAALLDAADRIDASVARFCRIPPSLLNTYSHGSLTYSTTAQEFHRWLLTGLYPMVLSRIEAAVSEFLPRGVSAVFDTSNLTRPDLAGEALSSADDQQAPAAIETASTSVPPEVPS